MSKVKYYYDSETLSYRKIETKRGRKVGVMVLFVAAVVLCSFILVTIMFNTALETPKEKMLKRELAQMQLQYKLLNKKMTQAQAVLANLEERDNNIYRLYFEANPIPEEQRKAGFGGVNRYEALYNYENADLLVSTTRDLEKLQKRLIVHSKSLDEIAKLAEDKEKFLASIPAIQPVNNEDLTRMASGYGFRSDPFTKARKMHWGMDFTAPRGTPVYASGDGVVIRSDNTASGFGKHIRIDHGYGYVSLYAHLSRYNVRKGEKVKRGDLIGFVGSTGRSQAPHLHYEIHKNGDKINPINFYYGNLSPQEFEELLKNAAKQNQSLD
ncbi:murein DD-endopeptidase MepM/ murein hydrolase activator NlpD [Kordia periserrulae]|uniref:Murein DD-endopeptidase MepM/ murein hydrolase activator NlpD n=1 Tax=Kordia periserrulae TaxID=701523 RepID=A0A2T6BRU1_9FLAO|nr:M23 family metallopeptidase [Kordia periserrulae]PTX58756.1 murein DD-endopeptidase MepM/ murein hydrolase activator NlpD [Kordia periserrulae]